MRRKALPRIDVVRREEKEARLTTFISSFIKSSPPAGQDCLLVARSLRSPVVRAVAALVEAGRFDFRILAILSCLETESDGEPASSLLKTAHSLRLASNPKLLEAHELLVLGAAASWFGDSMRRAPEKHDACEHFAPDCEETARQAQRSFEQLWKASEPVSPERCLALSRPARTPAGSPGRNLQKPVSAR